MADSTNLLEVIRQQAAGAIQSSELAAQAEATAAAGTTASFRTSEQTLKTIGTNAVIVKSQEQLGKLEAQTKTRAAFKSTGAEDALLKIISTVASEAEGLATNLDTLRQEQVDARGFSPIAKFRLALDSTGTQAKVTGAIQKIQALSAVSQVLEQRVGSFGALANSTAEVLTAGSAVAATRALQGEYDLKAQEAHRAALKSNAYEVQVWANADQRTLDLLSAQLGRERAATQEARLQEAQDFAQEEARLRRDERLDQKQLDAQALTFINAAEEATGSPLSSGLEAKSVLQQLKAGNKDLYEMYVRGKQIVTRGIPYVSFDAAGAAAILSKQGRINVPEERQKALQVVEAALVELNKVRGSDVTPGSAAARVKDDLSSDRDGNKTRAFINSTATRLLDEQYKFIGNNLDHPGHIGDLRSFIGTAQSPGISSIQSLPLVSQALNGAVTVNVALTDPNVVMMLALEGSRTGKFTLNQAASDLSTIYKRAAGIKRAERGYETFGLRFSKDPGYVVELDGKRVDVTNQEAVLKAMLKKESARFNKFSAPRSGVRF